MIFCGKTDDLQPRNTGKGVFLPMWTVFGVLLVLLLLGVMAMCFFAPGQDLPSALLRTGAALWGERGMPRAEAFGEKLEELLEDGDYTMSLSSGDGELSLVTDYARDHRILEGSLETGDAVLAYSVDRETFQFTVPGKFKYVYGVKLEKLDQLLDDPLFSSVLEDFRGTEEVSAEHGLENLFRNRVGEAFDALRRSVQIQQLEMTEFNGQRCRVYQVSWSGEATRQLLDALGAFPAAGERIRRLLPDFGSECICYVNRKGYIAGVEFTGDGVLCQLLLEGEKNPWDTLILKIQDRGRVYTGGLERSGSALRLCLENQEGIFLVCSYDDADGSFVFRTRDDMRFLSGALEAGEKLCLGLQWEKPVARQLTLTLEALRNRPSPLAETYVDLLSMDPGDMTRFLLDLGRAFN